jgi:uncharacterized damage-inducible protein DinB
MATAESRVLLAFLDAQRARALEVVAGLTDEQLNTAVLPSGWTPLGLIEHLGLAERHWFCEVALGDVDALPWAEFDDGAPFTATQPAAAVLAFYRAAIDAANDVVRRTDLSAPPRGRHGSDGDTQITDLRFVILHMIEETARHVGHLDVARELLDGRTGLGQDDL